MSRKIVLWCVVISALLAACGGSSSDADDAAVEQLNERIAELEAEDSDPTTPEAEPQDASPTPEIGTAETTAAAPPEVEALMPDVVCMNLQDAQDHIQSETGVFLSLSEDATGQGRNQIIDSNWIVVAQTPSTGTPIGEGDAVLSAVKVDEPNPC